jgi:hypothetical protein
MAIRSASGLSSEPLWEQLISRNSGNIRGQGDAIILLMQTYFLRIFAILRLGERGAR